MRKFILAGLALSLLAACAAKPPDFSAPVQTYLNRTIGHSYFGGRVACAYDLLGSQERGGSAEVYVWAFCGEYSLDDGTLTLDSASSLPVALELEEAGATYRVTGSTIPRDGTAFLPSLQAAFPPEAIRHMCLEETGCYNARAQRLEAASRRMAADDFGVK